MNAALKNIPDYYSLSKPSIKPKRPFFSSGPCAKRPGWSLEALQEAYIGRSHRAAGPKARLKKVIDLHKEILGIPQDYRVGIVPASDTGAFEMAMWSMLGARGIDILAWESFSGGWLTDIKNHLKLDDFREFKADYGQLPDLNAINSDRDIVFVWNGTTSGVRVPHSDWIAANRAGLTLCDATSAVFAYDLPWDKLDVTTWSWQKVLGGEAAHGMIVLSPRAIERLETFTPKAPLPKIFRMTKKGVLNEAIFQGSTINTPSMLATEDCLDALRWVQDIGGLSETIARSTRNLKTIEEWISCAPWIDFLTKNPNIRSSTSVCLVIVDEWFTGLSRVQQDAFVGVMCNLLEKERAGFDLKSYRDSPPGLRIWCGATVETADIQALLPWLDYAFITAKKEIKKDK